MVERKLDRLCRRARAEVVHTSLEAALPTIEMHTCQLTSCWCLKMHVKALTLANECAAVRRQVEHLLLRDLPYGLVDRLDVRRNLRNCLDRAVVGDDPVFHVIIPKLEVDELA